MAELIVALDLAGREDILDKARRLAGTLAWCKIGLQAFVAHGQPLVAELRAMGYNVFLDLKYHDIPNTVASAVRSAAYLGVRMLTIHVQGGEAMCRAAMQAARECEDRPLIYGVTVLTSFGRGEMPGIAKEPADFALELASLAGSWGLDGVVCSGAEAAAIKKATGLGLLCPGIRPAGAGLDDQSRVATPGEAVAGGADFLVVGRPLLRADDPVAMAGSILADMARGAGKRA